MKNVMHTIFTKNHTDENAIHGWRNVIRGCRPWMEQCHPWMKVSLVDVIMDDSSIRGCHPWMKMMDDRHGQSHYCAISDNTIEIFAIHFFFGHEDFRSKNSLAFGCVKKLLTTANSSKFIFNSLLKSSHSLYL